MELYLFAGLFLVYLTTGFMTKKEIHERIWTLAFVASFLIMGFTVILLRINHQGAVTIFGLDEYYGLYLTGSVCFVLGLINLWMYRMPLWHLFRKAQQEENQDNE